MTRWATRPPTIDPLGRVTAESYDSLGQDVAGYQGQVLAGSSPTFQNLSQNNSMSYDVYVYGTTDLTQATTRPAAAVQFDGPDRTHLARRRLVAPGDHTTHVGHGFAAGELQHDLRRPAHGSLSRAADLGHRL